MDIREKEMTIILSASAVIFKFPWRGWGFRFGSVRRRWRFQEKLSGWGIETGSGWLEPSIGRDDYGTDRLGDLWMYWYVCVSSFSFRVVRSNRRNPALEM